MILSQVIAIILFLLIGLPFGALGFWWLRKSRKMKESLVFGLVLILVFPWVGHYYFPLAYDCNSPGSCKTYYVLGDAEFKFGNGELIALNNPKTKCYILNDSDEILILEPVVYKFETDQLADYIDYSPEYIYPRSVYLHHVHGIEYWFDEEPPESMEIENDQNSVTHYWLHANE